MESPLLEVDSVVDEQRFEALVADVFQRLVNALRKVVNDRDTAEDAVQEALVRAYERRGVLQDLERLERWLFVVARNYARRVRRRSRQVQHRADLHVLRDLAATRDSVNSVEEAVEQALLREHVLKGLELLPRGQREILVLHYFQGCSVADLATRFQTTPNAVKVRLHRARQALRKRLTPSFDHRSWLSFRCRRTVGVPSDAPSSPCW
ncbi:MAG: hypothetical protein DIU84_04835 [Bacillota bacterium]|nr:MAG: hypothetical protein DIU84_04835 [Bacillota bacterium]